jgi:hypothetical protein
MGHIKQAGRRKKKDNDAVWFFLLPFLPFFLLGAYGRF